MTMLYTVQAGDSPARIAQRMTGQPARASELVSANPHKPRVTSQGQVTFGRLTVGEKLIVPAQWASFAGGAAAGLACGGCRTGYNRLGVGDASSVTLELQTLSAQASAAPTPDADGSYHGAVSAYQTAGQVAVTTGGLGPDIDSTYGIGATGSYTQAAYGTNAMLAAVPNGAASSSSPATLANAQNAQSLLQSMAASYQQAITAGQAAQTGGGGGGTTTPTTTTASLNAATVAAAQAIAQMGNPCVMNGTVAAFQTAYNGNAGVTPLTVDDKYGAATAAAASAALQLNGGAAAPAACSTFTGGGGGTTPSAPANPSAPSSPSAPSTPASPSTPVVAPTTTTAATSTSSGALAAGVILVAGGAAATVFALKRRKKHAHA